MFALQQRSIAAANAKPTAANFVNAIVRDSIFPQSSEYGPVKVRQSGVVKYGRHGEYVLHVGVDEEVSRRGWNCGVVVDEISCSLINHLLEYPIPKDKDLETTQCQLLDRPKVQQISSARMPRMLWRKAKRRRMSWMRRGRNNRGGRVKARDGEVRRLMWASERGAELARVGSDIIPSEREHEVIRAMRDMAMRYKWRCIVCVWME